MAGRNITRAEEQRGADLSHTLETHLPVIISGLSAEVKEKMSDHVMRVIGRNVPGRPSAESIRNLQYNWLIEHGHMDNLTPEQISGASKTEENEDNILNSGRELF